MHPTQNIIPWFLLLNPLISAVLILLVFRKSSGMAAIVSTMSSFFGLAAAAIVFTERSDLHSVVNWINLGPELQLNLGVQIDHLSKIMLLVVTGIGFLVHLYSTVYMEHDAAKTRFFGHLSLFMFSMLGIVLADNFAMMFMFWELVGVSSYLLIGHWFTKDSAGKAANKAFIMNRIGDFGFMLGILMLWSATGALSFEGLKSPSSITLLTANPTFLTVAVLLVFCGAIGKSAQFPLHGWLPDAMEGPTPVSALIHAATMVAAGVFMLARIAFLIGLSPCAAETIAWIGGITSILAALMATQQDDIKRILAYSTLSQLGYMVMAIGLQPDPHGGPAMFHLFTHAFFKALLFLGAGAIIHALHHEQNIWKMGGIAKTMKWTALTFAIGTLALTGCPGLSGFFSKDSILLAAQQKNGVLFTIALFTAFLTAFYMTRLFIVVFLGKARSEAAAHGHDCPARMTIPLVILAILSIGAGWKTETYFSSVHHEAHGYLVPILAIAVFLAGTLVAGALYLNKDKDPLSITLFRDKFYLDESSACFTGVQDFFAFLAAKIDGLIGGTTRILATVAEFTGIGLRVLQHGNIQGYTFIFGAGVVAVIYLFDFPMSFLTFIVFLPILAAIAIGLGAPARRTAIFVSGLNLALSLITLANYDHAIGGYQFTSTLAAISQWNLNLAFGADGLSLVMIFLTTVVTFAAVYVTTGITKREGLFYASLLLVSAGAAGAFASTDLFFFYAFHELALIPTFLLIGLWGSGDRIKIAWQITIYLAVGSIVLLIGLVKLYLAYPPLARTFDIPTLIATRHLIPSAAQGDIYIWLLIGFGILVSLFPFHTWAPSAYASAPAPLSMLHSGVLKKFGLYGLIRVALPLLPDGAKVWMDLLLILLVCNIIYVGLVTIDQKKLDLMLGYSSVMHMGYIFLGVAAGNVTGTTGAAFLMLAHGLSIAALFAMAGELRRKHQTLDFQFLGGLAKNRPFLGYAFGMAAFASIGLPGFANFASELMVFFGAFAKGNPNGSLWFSNIQLATIFALWGVVISAVYMLRMYRQIFMGEPNTEGVEPDDSRCGIRGPVILLLVALMIAGFFPQTFVSFLKPSIEALIPR